VGIESRRATAPPKTRSDRCDGWLAAELNLTPEQREQLKAIWSETASRGGHDREDRRRQLYRERDAAIVALIRPEDKPRYEEILKSHAEQVAALDREWHESFQTAIEKTKEILSPEQRSKYEELLQRHQKERGSRDWHRGERDRENGRRRDHDGPPHAAPPAGDRKHESS